MASSPRSIVTADIGGTNARLQYWSYTVPTTSVVSTDSSPVSLRYRHTYRPSEFTDLRSLLQQFFRDCAVTNGSSTTTTDTIVPDTTVLAVCGPTWDNGRKNESNNIPRWCIEGKAVSYHDADTMEPSLGLPSFSLVFINDFEAIGYSIAAFLDTSVPDICRPTPPQTLHKPSVPCEPLSIACCVGAGTGLGACLVVPTSTTTYRILPSEAGMTDTISPRNDKEYRLLQYLRKVLYSEGNNVKEEKMETYTEIERIVSGPGISDIYSWLIQEYDDDKVNQQHKEVIAKADIEDKAMYINQYAQENDTVCLEAIDYFLCYYGRFLATAGITFLSYGGLFIAGGILPKLAWCVPCIKNNLDSNPTTTTATTTTSIVDTLILNYLDGGSKMGNTLSRIPLYLLDDNDAGVKGCLYKALSLIKH